MSAPAHSLQEILHRPDIWRGLRSDSIGNRRTGHALLDRHLPGRGWPTAGLIELLIPRPGIGEMQLLIPTLRDCTQCWVAPPYRPYAPALLRAGLSPRRVLIVQPETTADTLWTLEQTVRAGSEDTVLGWCAQTPMAALRRLQLAAESTQTRLFLIRPVHCQQQPSPAPLRLYLDAADDGLYLRILKSRGGRPTAFVLPFVDPATAAAHPAVDTDTLPSVAHPHVVVSPAPAAAAAARPRPRAA